jgi:hypothetical protein
MEDKMPLEITIPALAKALSPIFASLAKGGIDVVKDQQIKWNSVKSVEKLSKLLLDINTVKTMWSRESGTLIDDFYYPSKLQKKAYTAQIKSIDDLPKHVIIEGIVGQGKSIYLRQLCNSAIEKEIIPIFLELRMISESRSLRQLIFDFLDSAGIEGQEKVLSYLSSTEKLVLILDGFDEIPTDKVTDTIYEIERLKAKHQNLKIIVSSRPYNAIQNLGGFGVFSLAELTDSDYEPFLRKLIPDITKRFSITQAIAEAPKNVKGVITTPLMLTLLVLVYQSESEIPSTLPIFFDKLFNTVFTKHDKLKAGFNRQHNSGLSESRLLKLFDAFCFMTLQSGSGRSLSHLEFNSSFEKAVKYTPDSNCQIEGFKKDIINVACLMLEDGFDQVTFLHKSILEYHSASFIRNSSDEIAKKFYRSAPENFFNWETTLTFLSNIDSYRYGRDYILSEYPKELSAVTSLLQSRNDKDLISYIEKKLPSLKAILSGSSLAHWSSVNSRRHSFTQELRNTIFVNTRLELGKASTAKLQKMIRESPQDRENLAPGQLEINLPAIITHLGSGAIWAHIAKIEQEIIDAIIKYQSIVDIELEKTSIFD